MNPGFSTDVDLLKRIRILPVGDEAHVGALVCTCWIRWGRKMRLEPHRHRLCARSRATHRDFLLPYLAIRNRKAGYAVSIVIAGTSLVGRSAGRVRPPLTDLIGNECERWMR